MIVSMLVLVCKWKNGVKFIKINQNHFKRHSKIIIFYNINGVEAEGHFHGGKCNDAVGGTSYSVDLVVESDIQNHMDPFKSGT